MKGQKRRLRQKILTYFKSLTIHRQMNLVIGSVCFLSVFLLSLHTYGALREKTLQSYEQSGALLLQETLGNINSKLMLVENIVYHMSYDNRVLNYAQQRDTSELGAYFGSCIELTRYDQRVSGGEVAPALIDDIFFVTDSDIFIARREHFSAYDIRTLLEQQAFVYAREHKGRRIWTEHLKNPTARAEDGDFGETHHFMYLSYLVDETLQYNLGYLGVSITLENLSLLLDELNTQSVWSFYIVDQYATVLAARDRGQITQSIAADAETLAHLQSGEEVRFQSTIAGERQYVYAAPLRINQWSLVITMPQRAVVHELWWLLLTTTLLGLLCLVYLTLLSGLVISNITKPLQSMVRSIREIRNKDFSQKVSADGSCEIAELSQEYNFMLARMDTLLAEIMDEQKALRQSQLNTLRAQINPHFLYNTLDTIKWLILQGDLEQSEQLLERLSEFFRLGLSGGSEEVSLSEELEHMRQYLEIQKIRLAGQFDYFIDCNLEVRSVWVNKLILQPIVENVIFHAFQDLPRHGLIHITAALEDTQTLCLCVADNGNGIAERALLELRKKLATPLSQETATKHGFAMRNIHQRLTLAYGKNYGVTLESVPGEGTRVYLRLPHQPSK